MLKTKPWIVLFGPSWRPRNNSGYHGNSWQHRTVLLGHVLEVCTNRITVLFRLEETSWDHLANPAAQEGSVEQVAQDHVQSDFEYLHRWNLYNLCQPVPAFDHTDSKSFLVFVFNLMGFNLCWLLLVVSLGTAEKSLSPSSSFPLTRY